MSCLKYVVKLFFSFVSIDGFNVDSAVRQVARIADEGLYCPATGKHPHLRPQSHCFELPTKNDRLFFILGPLYDDILVLSHCWIIALVLI